MYSQPTLTSFTSRQPRSSSFAVSAHDARQPSLPESRGSRRSERQRPWLMQRAPQNHRTPDRLSRSEVQIGLRGEDLNLRPSGYEPDELPGCSTARQWRVTYPPNSSCQACRAAFCLVKSRVWTRARARSAWRGKRAGARRFERHEGRGTVKLTSTAFKNGDSIPTSHTCEGADRSPPLAFEDVPPAAKSLVLIVDDPDAPDPRAPKRTWVHWLVHAGPRHRRGRAHGHLPKTEVNGFEGGRRSAP